MFPVDRQYWDPTPPSIRSPLTRHPYQPVDIPESASTSHQPDSSRAQPYWVPDLDLYALGFRALRRCLGLSRSSFGRIEVDRYLVLRTPSDLAVQLHNQYYG